VNANQLKQFCFIAFLAAFIAMFMIGGIWFSSTLIPSPAFWLVDVGFLAVSIVFLITWQIEKAYFGITLEPEDLIEDDETAEKEMKMPAVPVKKQAIVSVPAVKPAKPAKPAVKKPATMKAQAPTAMSTAVSPPAKKAAPSTGQKQPAMVKPATIDQEKAKQDAAKLHDVFATVPTETSKQLQQPLIIGKKVKISKKNVFSMIEAYAGADYTYFSFSKIRKELGAANDKDAMKIKKILLDACQFGLLVKKGSKYFLQKE